MSDPKEGLREQSAPIAVDASVAQELLRLVFGFRTTQAIYVMAKLGLADLLVEGPRSAEDLGACVDAHAASLYRLLRALATLGLLSEDRERRFSLTRLGAPLRSGMPGSVRAVAMLYGEETYQAYGHLLHTVRTGATAFDHLFGMGLFEYLPLHPEAAATFNTAMNAGNEVYEPLPESYDLRRFRQLVDVGGGHGSVAAVILKAVPELTAVIFDLPSVVAGAAEYLSRAGVLDRCRLVAGNFFESVPDGGDLYLLSNVIHGQDDEHSRVILGKCRAVMPARAVLLLLELVLPPPGEPVDHLADLTMMVVPGGQERTEQEYRSLLAGAGFQLTQIIPTKSGSCLIEARPY